MKNFIGGVTEESLESGCDPIVAIEFGQDLDNPTDYFVDVSINPFLQKMTVTEAVKVARIIVDNVERALEIEQTMEDRIDAHEEELVLDDDGVLYYISLPARN